MSEVRNIIMSGGAGILIGIFFFGGLWWTVRHGIASRYAAVWFIAGLIVRMSIALTGFYFIGGAHWQRLLACLSGFVIARIVMVRITGSQMTYQPPSSETQRAS